MQRNRGISLLELIIVIAIIGVLATYIISSSTNQLSWYALQKTSDSVAALLEKAHNRAVTSYNGVKHSVKLESSRAILFEGTTYATSSATNQIVTYDPRVILATTSINGAASTITFNKVTGVTNQYGSIRFEVINASTSSSTVRIGQTGIIQIQ